MASPGEFKGQRRGSCGHVMAAFDSHDKCACCRNKKVGEDPCVKGQACIIVSGGYYGLLMSTPPQCVEIFSLPL